ncbi:MAG: multidrug efflux MFS transporter [Acidobacteria bacterium]|nr:multidrug efflux MFS transporter [Acidobacteriota bacterium]
MIDAYRRRLALLVASCYFMENLDGTIVTTAAPKLRAALGVSSTAIGLLISTYLMTFAVVIPVGNWLMSRLGERRLFLSAIAVFTAASLLCAVSQHLSELVVARSLQGVGAALMVPVGRIVVLANVDKTDIMRLVAYIVWPSLLAPAVAPLVGGIIVTLGSWRWLFLPNVPLGVIAFSVGAMMMKPSTRRDPRVSALDWRGMILTGAGLGGLVYSAFVAGELTSSWARVSLGLGGSSVLLGVAVMYLSRRREPFLDVGLLRVATFRQSLRGIIPFTMVVGSIPLLLPLMFQDRFGWSPIKSGAIVLFVFIGNVVAKPATTPLLNRWGYRRVLLSATAAVTLTMLVFALFDATTPVTLIAATAFVNGVVRSIGYTGFLTLVYSDIDERDMAHGTTLAATVQQVATAFAASAGVVALRVGGALSHGDTVHSQSGYRIAFVLLAALGATSTLNAFMMHPSAGDVLRTVRASRD